jgi:hypothetical protein
MMPSAAPSPLMKRRVRQFSSIPPPLSGEAVLESHAADAMSVRNLWFQLATHCRTSAAAPPCPALLPRATRRHLLASGPGRRPCRPTRLTQ